jgi:hypothetical protein
MSAFTRARDRLTHPQPIDVLTFGATAVAGAASAALTPDINTPDGQPLPNVPGPQDVAVRPQTPAVSSATDVTELNDLPGTGLFGPKKKAASRALVGY